MTAKKPMPIWDKRMLQLMDHVTTHKIKNISDNSDFIKVVGIPTLSTISQVKASQQSFRAEHLFNASKIFNVSMDWFFGFTDNMKRDNKKETVESLLQQALTKLKANKK